MEAATILTRRRGIRRLTCIMRSQPVTLALQAHAEHHEHKAFSAKNPSINKYEH